MNFLQTIIPMPMNNGDGDPNFLLAFFIAVNAFLVLFLIICFLVGIKRGMSFIESCWGDKLVMIGPLIYLAIWNALGLLGWLVAFIYNNCLN